MASQGPLYLGFDLSTQQLKGLVVDHNLKLQHEAKVSFDDDLSKHGIQKGVLTNPAEHEIFAPVAMWLDAIELVLTRLRESGCDFSRVKGLSGAGMQHGTVFWSADAERLLASLDPSRDLTDQLEPSTEVDDRRGAFSHPHSPNWQDASTQKQCEAFDAVLGGPRELAEQTGSSAHHRFSGPQIMRWRQKYPSEWKATSRISLVSSFISTVFLGKFAPIDISDVCGMNLWDMNKGQWHPKLLALAAGDSSARDLEVKLGEVARDTGRPLGPVSDFFVKRHGFPSDCSVFAATGDNPATIISLPLRPSDAMVSLGTSTTFLMSTPKYNPDPAYHFMHHPTTPGLHMFMLCYKNGGLAREMIRDRISPSKAWDAFNTAALDTPPLSLSSTTDSSPMTMGLYFPRHEIVPNVPAGEWRYTYDPTHHQLSALPTSTKDASDARTIVESQMLSLRLRSHNLMGDAQPDPSNPSTLLPPQPRRVYLVGGASSNPAIARIAGDVLGGVEGVYKLDIGANACALGAAYKAVWGANRSSESESFEDFIAGRWDEREFVVRIADGYRKGVWERYGEALKGFEAMEQTVLRETGDSAAQKAMTGGVFVQP